MLLEISNSKHFGLRKNSQITILGPHSLQLGLTCCSCHLSFVTEVRSCLALISICWFPLVTARFLLVSPGFLLASRLCSNLHLNRYTQYLKRRSLPENRPFSYFEKESQSNDVCLHFEEFSKVHNSDRSPNATPSNLIETSLDPDSFVE